MSTRRVFERVVAWSARHARPLIVGALVLGALAAVRVFTLQPATGFNTLVDTSSKTYKETRQFQQEFGADPIYVVVNGPLNQLLYTGDLARIAGLEGCISGNVPRGARPPRGVCEELAKIKPAKVVYGPGTFINESARVITRGIDAERAKRAAEARRAYRAARKLALAQGLGPVEARRLGERARQVVYAQFVRDVLKLGLRYGISGLPSITNPEFIDALVFDPKRGAGQPKSRFAYLFPNADHALIQVRLRPNLSEAGQRQAVKLIGRATEDPAYRLKEGSYLVSGPVVVAEGASEAVSDSLIKLLVIAVLVMAVTLALIFRVRLRLLPLGLALVAALIAFAALSLVGVTLTLASVAVLPILIGLGVDYAVQLQSRREDLGSPAIAIGESAVSPMGGAPSDLGGDSVPDRISPQTPLSAVSSAAGAGAPAIGLACLATAIGMLALGLSPVAMVRSFGAVLFFGTLVAFVVSLAVGSAALSLRRRGAGAGFRRLPALRAVGVLRERLASLGGRLVAVSVQHPVRVLAVAGVVALLGWLGSARTGVESDLQKLLPQNLEAVQDLNALQRATGSSGEIDVVVHADDVTSRPVVDWMTRYEGEALKRNGYVSEDVACANADLCPAYSLPSLFRSTLDHGKPSAARIRSVLDAVPRYFSQAVVSADRRTATITFGVRAIPLSEQKRVVDELRDLAGGAARPPPDVRAEVVGLPVLAAEANASLSGSRYPMAVFGLVAVFAVLLVAYRNVRRALPPLVPILLATGWSGLAVYLVGIPLNPMSATLGALVIAITTEFSVILADRYRSERRAGKDAAAALVATYASTGKAAAISGVTAVFGFAVLIASNIAMVSDFGVVAVIDLAVSLAGVMLVLPAALVLGERIGGRKRRGDS